MARYRGTVVSTRSDEETFDYLADFANAAEWDPGTATAEPLDGGPLGLGSRFRLEVRVGTRIDPVDYRIVAYDRPRAWCCSASTTPSARRTPSPWCRPPAAARCSPTTPTSAARSPRRANPLLPALPRRSGTGVWPGCARPCGPRRPGTDASPAGAWSRPGGRRGSRGHRRGQLHLDRTRRSGAEWPAGGPRPAHGRASVVLITGATSGLGLATAAGVGHLGADGGAHGPGP